MDKLDVFVTRDRVREIRIVGRKDVLEQAVLAKGALVPGVRSFVRKWRTRHDSNV
jgi:hypothetical protein